MAVISFANLKGGAGKTTSVIYFAYILSKKSRVLVIDLDKQANASSFWQIPEARMMKDNIVTLLKKGKTALKKTIFDAAKNIDLIPGILDIQYFDEFFQVFGKELMLKDLIYPALRKDYDYILIDCPPDLGTVTRNAIVASDYIIVPIFPHVWAYEGASKLLASIDNAKKSALRKEIMLKDVFILPTREGGIFGSYQKGFFEYVKQNLENKILPGIGFYNKLEKTQTAGNMLTGKIVKEYEKAIKEILNG